jgi:hypothetical protein
VGLVVLETMRLEEGSPCELMGNGVRLGRVESERKVQVSTDGEVGGLTWTEQLKANPFEP